MVNHQSEMLLVQNSVQLLQGRVQCDFLESFVGRFHHWVAFHHVPFQCLGLQASKCGHALNFAKYLDRNIISR